jgi:outer membrane lipoprotein-sorting protein
MINKNLFLVILFFITGTLFAQNALLPAAPILDRTAQKFNDLSAFSLDFTVKIEENGKTVLNFKGVAFGKKEKYFLSFDDQIIANDGKMMWNYQKNTNEAVLLDAEDDDFLMFHPTKILNNWNKEYVAVFIKEDELQDKQVFVLDLTPKNKSQFYKMRLFIDKATSYIQQVVMYETENTTVTYTITKFTPNAVISDAKFTFNKKDYPNVQVIDMR